MILTFLKARGGLPGLWWRISRRNPVPKIWKKKGHWLSIRLKCISNTWRKELRSEEMIWNKAGESILSLGILSPRTPAGRYWSSQLGLACTAEDWWGRREVIHLVIVIVSCLSWVLSCKPACIHPVIPQTVECWLCARLQRDHYTILPLSRSMGMQRTTGQIFKIVFWYYITVYDRLNAIKWYIQRVVLQW